MSGSEDFLQGKYNKTSQRKRTVSTDEQLEDLNILFSKNPYLDRDLQVEVASKMNIDPTVVQVWFKNHRAKLKRAKSTQVPPPQEAQHQTPLEDPVTKQTEPEQFPDTEITSSHKEQTTIWWLGFKNIPGPIQLWDTAGQERFRKSMVQHYYRNVHAVVFVYDMTNMASFHSLPSWIEECKQHLLADDIPRILVGNKCDLRSAIQVPTDLAQKFADTHSMPLFETSAKNPNDNDHVEAIFMTLAHKLKSHKPLMLSQPPDNGIILKPEPKPAMMCWC
nr:ras-related protein Rab-33B [Oryctolagus cuniculus]